MERAVLRSAFPGSERIHQGYGIVLREFRTRKIQCCIIEKLETGKDPSRRGLPDFLGLLRTAGWSLTEAMDEDRILTHVDDRLLSLPCHWDFVYSR